MIINDKKCIVFDIEILPNIFTCTTKDTETKEIKVFESSIRKNEFKDLVKYFTNENAYFVGFNNIHFDNPIINYIIEFKNTNNNKLINSIYNMARLIIDSKNSDQFDEWKRWKFANNFNTIDLLTMMFSSKLRVSLKTIQVTLHYPNVLEFVHDWNKPLEESRFDELIKYNINDVESTEMLLNYLEHRLRLREEFGKSYNLDLLSVDDVNAGMKILASEYMRKTGIKWNVLKNMGSPCEFVDMNKVISPIVKFEDPILIQMLNRLKQQSKVAPGRKGYEDTFIYGGMKITIGVGGIHGDNGTCTIIPKDDEELLDWDVKSLYPSFKIEHKFIPPHLGMAYWETYRDIRTKRFSIPKEVNLAANTMLKYALNGPTGMLQQPYSWVYSPFTVMQIRMNGQLFLLMLCEKLNNIGCDLKQINTDGVLFIAKKEKKKELEKIKQEWEAYTKLQLEEENFKSFYQSAINDYFGEYTNGKIKRIGLYKQDIEIGRGLAPKIIPKAVEDYFLKNIPIEDTIINCKDILQFLQSEKTDQSWDVYYNNKKQQLINRFFISNNGAYLQKRKIDPIKGLREERIVADFGVTIHNKLYTEEELQQFEKENKTFKDIYDINYSYYISQARKLIENLKPRQLSLW